MDTITGIPAHPLMVHIPVVLLPLAALVSIVLLIKQSWFERYKWALLAITGIGAAGGLLAGSTGEGLEHDVKKTGAARDALRNHTEAGGVAQTFGVVFFCIVAVWILLPVVLDWRARRTGGATSDPAGSTDSATSSVAQPKWLRPVVAALVVISAGVATYTVVDAGHSGAKSVWTEETGG
jgi:uncharacterized membrane protein